MTNLWSSWKPGFRPIVEFDHPLAVKKLLFDVKILNVQGAATPHDIQGGDRDRADLYLHDAG